MAKFIGDDGWEDALRAQMREGTQRPGNHKAVWTEAAERELEMLVMRKETVWYLWDNIIKLLEVEPRESAPQEYSRADLQHPLRF